MADEAQTEDAPKTTIATLKRGLRYVYKGTHYKRDEEAEIDDATAEYFRKNAVDKQRIDGEYDEDGKPAFEVRQKFTFRAIGSAAPAPRRRRPA